MSRSFKEKSNNQLTNRLLLSKNVSWNRHYINGCYDYYYYYSLPLFSSHRGHRGAGLYPSCLRVRMVDTLGKSPAHHRGDKHPVTLTLTDDSELPTSRNVLNLIGAAAWSQRTCKLHRARLQTLNLCPSRCEETVKYMQCTIIAIFLTICTWLLNFKFRSEATQSHSGT